MYTYRKAFVSILLSISGFTAFPQDILDYTVNKTDDIITIDGILDEEAWTAAPATSNFVVLGEETTPSTVTWSKVLWDTNYLYIAFHCEDSAIWATYNTHDAELYREDAVEIYIDADGDGLNYIELEVNPINATFDLWLDKPWDEGGTGNKDWDFNDMTTAVQLKGTNANNADTDTSWICEMALPFTEMSFLAPSMHYPPVKDDMWRFNLYRFDRASTNDPLGEATGWSQTSGGQHEPEFFGNITFADDSPPDAITESYAATENLVVYQNYPNPFSNFTTIRYFLAQPGNVTLNVMDISGRLIYSASAEQKPSGEYSLTLNANQLRSGTYFYSVQTNSEVSKLQKMLVTK
jgi:hypothetical protein